jgi:hypothetical protein
MDGLNVYEFSPYHHCYCEENAYRFLEKLAIAPPPPPEGEPTRKYDGYAAFITSYSATPGTEVAPGEWQCAVPIVSGPKPSDIVYWDYHCVAVVKETTPPKEGDGEPSVRWWVVDYDTKMGKGKFLTPVPMELFFGFTLSAAGKNAVARVEGRVRFVKSIDFLTKFRSDRRHMYLRSILKEDKYKTLGARQLDKPSNFQHPPPANPRIQGPSPAALMMRGEISRAQAAEALTAHLADQQGKNTHANNLAQFLNTQNTEVCPSELVGIKEVGQWIKAHS